MRIPDSVKRLNPLLPLSNNRGVALLMAMFSMMILIFIAVEVSYDTNVEYVLASQQVNRLKAYYAAKGGLELSLLRIQIYKKVMSQFGEQLGANKSMLDPIWQLPFTWPPMLPDEVSTVDKDLIQGVVDESMMEAQIMATIESEGGKIDINDLAAFGGESAEALQKSTREQILKIFASKIENDKEFGREYGTFRFDDLVNHMTDWIDENQQSRVAGDERSYYPDVPNEAQQFVPPNQPFKTIEELHMVAGMTDELYEVLKPRITVYGIKGMNVNYAPAEVLETLDPQITKEVVEAILKRRSDPEEGGPFTNEDDFYDFLAQQGVRLDPKAPHVPLVFDAEYNFRIISTGVFANSTREITAVTYDLENITERYLELTQQGTQTGTPDDNQDDDDKKNDAGDTASGDGTPSDSGTETPTKTSNGRPTIVYWNEN